MIFSFKSHRSRRFSCHISLNLTSRTYETHHWYGTALDEGCHIASTMHVMHVAATPTHHATAAILPISPDLDDKISDSKTTTTSPRSRGAIRMSSPLPPFLTSLSSFQPNTPLPLCKTRLDDPSVLDGFHPHSLLLLLLLLLLPTNIPSR